MKTSSSEHQNIERREQSKICQLHHAVAAKRGGGYITLKSL